MTLFKKNNWLRLLLLMGNLIFLPHTQAQVAQHAFAISFTDKKDTSSSKALSPRSMERRVRYGIAVDSTDRVVYQPYIDSVLTVPNAILHHTSKWLNHVVVLVNDSDAVDPLRTKPFIKQIKYIGFYFLGLHQNHYSHTSPPLAAETKAWPLRYGRGNAAWYNYTWNQNHLTNGDSLHSLGYLGEGKLIALLDAGYAQVPAMKGFDSMRYYNLVRDGYDFIHNDTTVYDTDMHGTYSLSNISGYVAGEYVGTAPKASLALYTTEIGGSEQYLEMYNLLAATERADSIGADIITVSLGYNTFGGPEQTDLTLADIDGKTTIAAQAANLAVAKGIVFVSSAGNEGGNSWNRILTPGDADSAITVGNVDNAKTPNASSGYGPNYAGAVKPNVATQGSPAMVYTSNNSIIAINGTSESTPQIAGWIACLLEAKPALRPFEVKKILEKSAHLYPATHPQMGYGVPNFISIIKELNITKKPDFKVHDKEWVRVAGSPVEGNEIPLVYYSLGSGKRNWKLLNNMGAIMSEGMVSLQAGSNNFSIPKPQATGIYHLQIEGKSELLKAKISVR